MDVAHFAAFVSGASSSSSTADRYRDYYDSIGAAGASSGNGSGSGSGSDLFPSTVLIGSDDPGLFAAYQVPRPSG